MWQGAIYLVTAIIAVFGLFDLVKDELELRASPSDKRPKNRKRIAQLIAVSGAVVLAILTWQLDRINDREAASLRARLAGFADTQREMDRAANAVAQARIGIRSGIETLQSLALQSRDADVRRRSSVLLASVRTDYQRSLDNAMKEADTKTGVELLAYYGLPEDMVNEAITLPVVVKIIRSDQDLNRVACAFAAFSQLTGAKTEVFNFGAVESRCAAVRGRC